MAPCLEVSDFLLLGNEVAAGEMDEGPVWGAGDSDHPEWLIKGMCVDDFAGCGVPLFYNDSFIWTALLSVLFLLPSTLGANTTLVPLALNAHGSHSWG